MPVFRLTDRIIFPPPDLAEADGLLAVGGDLSVERLLAAYANGIFPWYSEDAPILWWSPDPRLVLLPGELKVSRSLKQTLRKQTFEVTFDRDFAGVIKMCAKIRRKRERGTWITGEMRKAYVRLHEEGHAHSVECWHKGELAGGLYGVALGRAFFGESMFSRIADASKVALVRLTERLASEGYDFIDCQVTTDHLVTMGAREISRDAFLGLIEKALRAGIQPGKWT